jgi:hypothetical protein
MNTDAGNYGPILFVDFTGAYDNVFHWGLLLIRVPQERRRTDQAPSYPAMTVALITDAGWRGLPDADTWPRETENRPDTINCRPCDVTISRSPIALV